MKLLVTLFAFFAVASAGQISSLLSVSKSDDLQKLDANSTATASSGMHIRFKHEYDDLVKTPKPADAFALDLCEPGAIHTAFFPVGSCHWMDQTTCDPSKTGMFWFTRRHNSIYARCHWSNDACTFVPSAPDNSDLCRYEWHPESL